MTDDDCPFLSPELSGIVEVKGAVLRKLEEA